MTARHVMHFRNPFKWGWYYVEGPNEPMTGLMSKRAARRYMRSAEGRLGYGYRISYPSKAPSIKLFRRIGFPVRNTTFF